MECPVVLGKSHKMANRVPSYVSVDVNDLSLNIRREMEWEEEAIVRGTGICSHCGLVTV